MRRGLWVWVACGATALAGCRCDPPISNVPLGFRVDRETLDFGRVLEGDTRELPVTLTAETRAGVAVDATTSDPFEVAGRVTVPGGSDLAVPVLFHAGDGPAAADLTFSANQKSLIVHLTGVGVRPPPCNPTAPCTISTYDLPSDTCVVTPAPDDTPCDPGNECLTQGRCRAMVCVGVARSCDDNNKCTSDACAPDAGCVRTPVQCPAPGDPCKVATCDPLSGCGVGNALDGIACGSISCTDARVCVSGTCQSIVPPDGTPCSSALACLPPATCQNQQCVRPDAGPWLPAWSAQVDGVPQGGKPALLTVGSQVYFTVCGVARDAGSSDGGGGDAGTEDGGADGGVDAGADGGAEDGGADGGPVDDGGVCALSSYTMTGFNRFVTPFDGQGVPQLVSAGPGGVVLLGDAGLTVHSRTTGGAVASLALPGVHLRGVATLWDGGLALAGQLPDGGAALASWTSGGLAWGDALSGPAALVALDADGLVSAWEPGAGVWQGLGASAALSSRLPSLVVSQGTALVGAQHLVRADAGVASVVDVDWSGDGGPYELLAHEVLAAGRTADAFFLRCDDGFASCLPQERSTWVRAFDTVTGVAQWDARVLPGGIRTTLSSTALVSQVPGAVATVVGADFGFDGGQHAYLQVFSQGARVLLCPLEGVKELTATAFVQGQLLVLGVDVDGGARLEAYDAPGLALPSSGWATDDAVGGSRRESP